MENKNMQNRAFKNTDNFSKDLPKTTNKFTKSLAIGAAVASATILIPLIAEATFDVNAGVTAATKPLIDGVTAHWGKAVLLSGVALALIGEGDPKQRAVRAIIGCGGAGATVLGLIALLS
jgi:hypothetical protein